MAENVARGPIIELPSLRRRKPNLDKLIAKAKAAGATSAVIDPSGAIELKFGNAVSGNGAATDVDRELAEFEARHET